MEGRCLKLEEGCVGEILCQGVLCCRRARLGGASQMQLIPQQVLPSVTLPRHLTCNASRKNSCVQQLAPTPSVSAQLR